MDYKIKRMHIRAVQIVVLRVILQCSLPIEVFYGGDKDLPEQNRYFINSLPSSFPSLGSISTINIKKRFRILVACSVFPEDGP